jgi:hypothetical protein
MVAWLLRSLLKMRLNATRLGSIASSRSFGDQLDDLAGQVPSLDLNFAQNKSLIDDYSGTTLVTHTRASSGTYVDSEGVIRTAVTNLLLRSEEFDNASWAKLSSSIAVNAVTAPNGTLTADKLIEDTSSGGHFIEQLFTASATTFTASIYAKAAGRSHIRGYLIDSTGIISGSIFRVDLSTGAASQGSPVVTAVSDGWYRISMSGSLNGSSMRARWLISTPTTDVYTGDGTSGLYFWGAQLEQSATVGEYIPTTSTINSAPRFDHNPTTGESLGLLVEEARTNLLLRSEEFDDASWTKSNGSITPNTITAPNSTFTADKLVEDTANSGHFIYTNVSWVANQDYVLSVNVKRSESGRYLSMCQRTGSAFPSNLGAIFDPADGSIATNTLGAGYAGSESLGDGWYRCWIIVTPNASVTTSGVNIRLSDDSVTIVGSYTGDGTSGIYLWGAQLEAGAFPTSYIPTVAATVTRAADVASITGSNFSSWYRQDEGTVFSDSSIIASQVKTQAVWELTGGTVLSSLRQPQGTLNQFRAVIGGTFTGSPGTGASLTTGVTFAAVAYSGTAGRLQVGSVGTDTTGSALDATSLSIGSLAGLTQLNGRIKRLCFWPTRLSNEVLQRITQ